MSQVLVGSFHTGTQATRDALKAGVLFMLGGVLSVVAFGLVYRAEQDNLLVRFERLSQDRVEALRRTLDSNLNTLQALQALFASSYEVERQEFARFTLHLRLKQGEIAALEWLPRTLRADRDALEARVREAGFASFQIVEADAHGALVRAASREEHFPVAYVEPLETNDGFLGVDHASFPSRRSVMDRARDAGEAMATSAGVVLRLGESARRIGVMVFQPIYHGGTIPVTTAERRARLQGFVTEVFYPDELIETALAPLSPVGINVGVFDETEDAHAPTLLHARPSRLRQTSVPAAGQRAGIRDMAWRTHFEVAGREWYVDCSPAKEFYALHAEKGAWIVLWGGLLLSGIMAWYVGRLAKGRRQLHRESTQREIAQQKIEELAKFPEENPNPVLRLASDRTLLYANEPSRALLDEIGWQPGQALQGEVGRLVEEVWRTQFDREVEVNAGGRIYQLAVAAVRGMDYVNIYGRDVTARTQAEAEVRLGYERFQLVGRATNDAIWDWDLVANRLSWGGGITTVFGHQADQLEPGVDSWQKRVHPDDAPRVMSSLDRVLESAGRAWSAEYRFQRRDGSYAEVLDRGYVIRAPDGKPTRMVGAMQDVTGRNEAERLKQELLDVLSHELRIPMTSIQEGVRLLSDGAVGNPTPEQTDVLNTVAGDIERLATLSDKALLATQIISKTLAYQFQALDGRDLLTRVLERYQPKAQARGVRLEVAAGEEPVPGVGDPKRLLGAFGELTENAIQATPKDGTVTLSVASTPDGWQVTVQDTGLGIPERALTTLFKRFGWIGGVDERRPGGVGLGLFIARSIIESHQGTLSAASAIGQGTRMMASFKTSDASAT